jgi:hypothetical protein
MKHGFLRGHKVAECQDSQTQLMARFLKDGVVDEWRDAEAASKQAEDKDTPSPPQTNQDTPAPGETLTGGAAQQQAAEAITPPGETNQERKPAQEDSEKANGAAPSAAKKPQEGRTDEKTKHGKWFY